MNIWMWLLIGFLTGLVVAAIVSLLFRGGSAKEEDQVRNDTAAKLAKAEVKITMLEDKLRLANADQLALQAKLEGEHKEKLDAAYTEYQAALATLASENSTLTAALANAQAEQKALQEQIDLQQKIIEFDAGTIAPEVEDKGTGLEDQIVFIDVEEAVDENLVPDTSKEYELLESNIVPETLIAATMIGFNEEKTELENEDGLRVERTESLLEPEVNEEVTVDSASADQEAGADASANGEQSVKNGEEIETAVGTADDALDSPVEELAFGAAAIGATILHNQEEEPVTKNELVEDFRELPAVPVIDEEGEIGSEVDDFPLEDSALSDPDPEDESTEESVDAVDHEDSEEFELINNFEEIPDIPEDEEASEDWSEVDRELGSDNLEVQASEDNDDDENAGRDFAEWVAGAGTAAVAFASIDGDDEESEKDEYNVEEELPDDAYESVPVEEPEAAIIGDIGQETKTPLEEVDEILEAAEPDWPEDLSVWKGEYFNNMKLDGEPEVVREDAEINFDWQYGSPSPEINVDNFSARWIRKANLPPGLYRFTVTSDDGVRLWVNERLTISAWYDHSPMTFRREMELPGGPVNLRLEYYEKDMTALVFCSWERIG